VPDRNETRSNLKTEGCQDADKASHAFQQRFLCNFGGTWKLSGNMLADKKSRAILIKTKYSD